MVIEGNADGEPSVDKSDPAWRLPPWPRNTPAQGGRDREPYVDKSDPGGGPWAQATREPGVLVLRGTRSEARPPPRHKCCSAWLRNVLVRGRDLLICTHSKGGGEMSVEAVTASKRGHGPPSCRDLARESDHLLTLLHDQRSDLVSNQNDLSAMALCVRLQS